MKKKNENQFNKNQYFEDNAKYTERQLCASSFDAT